MSSRFTEILSKAAWPLGGFLMAVALWALFTSHISNVGAIQDAFSPQAGFKAWARLLADGTLWPHIAISLQRVAAALGIAAVIGIPLGLLTGLSARFARTTGTLFQFLRMVSPLSWMPLAVMVLGVGDAPVIFLLAFAAIWPLVLSTAAGVTALDRNWLLLAASLSATRWETLTRVILPGIVPHVLTGLRLAIGLAWIVLVPAEMLGVSAGLGYFILDTRDRLAYDELTAGILTIGTLGFALDITARWLSRRWSGKRT